MPFPFTASLILGIFHVLLGIVLPTIYLRQQSNKGLFHRARYTASAWLFSSWGIFLAGLAIALAFSFAPSKLNTASLSVLVGGVLLFGLLSGLMFLQAATAFCCASRRA